MEKETLNIIREMLREELEPIKYDIKELKKGQDSLEIEVKEIKKGQDGLEREVKELKKGQDSLEIEVKEIKKGQDGLEREVKEIKKGQENLEKDVKEIKTMVGELDPKNANRHLELQESIALLKKDMSTVETITASNYSDIVRLKNIK